jgi:cytochrome c
MVTVSFRTVRQKSKEVQMKLLSKLAFGLSVFAAPLFADGHATGDASKGENVFKKCKACHSVIADDGTVIQKGGKTGPNLYGVYTRIAGSAEGFKYGKDIVAAGEAGLIWDEASLVSYVANPKKFLAGYLDDSGAKSRMSFKLKKAEDAANVWAYLVSIGPEVTTEAETSN